MTMPDLDRHGGRPPTRSRQLYAVLICDLRKPADRLVATRSTRVGARRLARRLNAEAVRLHGLRAPLYYAVRNIEE
jgi:hypothetical protein